MSFFRAITIITFFPACLDSSGQRLEAPSCFDATLKEASSRPLDYSFFVAKKKESLPAAGRGESKIVVPLMELKLSGKQLAALYHRYTGRRVNVSYVAEVAEFRCVFDATPQRPVSYQQAAERIKKAAEMEGFLFVVDGLDPNMDALTAPDHRHYEMGIPVFNEQMELPKDNDLVISYVMTLKHVSPAEAARFFTDKIDVLLPYRSVAPVANASAVVITASVTDIKKSISFKMEIDIPD